MIRVGGTSFFGRVIWLWTDGRWNFDSGRVFTSFRRLVLAFLLDCCFRFFRSPVVVFGLFRFWCAKRITSLFCRFVLYIFLALLLLLSSTSVFCVLRFGSSFLLPIFFVRYLCLLTVDAGWDLVFILILILR